MIRPPDIEPGGFVQTSWSLLILYGMLGFCFFSHPLLLQILGQSRLIAPLYRRWKPMTILRMVTIIYINVIIWVVCHYSFIQDGWIRLDLGFYMSLSTGSRFSTSSQSKISLEIFALSPYAILGLSRTVCAQLLAFCDRRLLRRTWRPQGRRRQDSGDGCQMWFVNSWAWDGPVICNEIRLVCGTEQSGERCQAEMYSLFYLCSLFSLFVGKVILIIMKRE